MPETYKVSIIVLINFGALYHDFLYTFSKGFSKLNQQYKRSHGKI